MVDTVGDLLLGACRLAHDERASEVAIQHVLDAASLIQSPHSPQPDGGAAPESIRVSPKVRKLMHWLSGYVAGTGRPLNAEGLRMGLHAIGHGQLSEAFVIEVGLDAKAEAVRAVGHLMPRGKWRVRDSGVLVDVAAFNAVLADLPKWLTELPRRKV